MIKFYEIKKIQDSQTKILRKIDRYLYREANVFENTRVTQKWYRIISDSPHLSNNQKGSRPCSNRQMRGRRRATAKCVATPCWRVSDRHNIWNCPRSGWTGSVSRVTIGRCECKCVPTSNRDSAHPSDILVLLIKTYVQNRKSESSLSYIFLLSVSFFFFFWQNKNLLKRKIRNEIRKKKKNLIINYINDILFSSTFLNYRIIIVEESKVRSTT